MSIYKEFVRDLYREGEITPWYKGFVSYDYARQQVRVTLIGFNIPMQLVYSFWLSLRIGIKDIIGFKQRQINLRKALDDPRYH